MKKHLISALQLVNLDDEEIRLFMLLLKLGKATRSELAVKCQLHPLKSYRLLQKLIDAELVITEELQKEFLYRPQSLDMIIRRAKSEERKLRKLTRSLEDMKNFFPFMELHTEENAPERIEFREGLEAFKEEYFKIPDQCDREFLYVGSTENFWKTAGFGYESAEERGFIHHRLQKGIFARALNPPSIQITNIQRNDEREKRILKTSLTIPVKQNFFTLTERQASHFICDAENPRVIVISQPDIMQLYHEHFSVLWQKAHVV